ncbi:MAG: response regulator [Desulfamplus sp.]|nr:response regulator [Desulfamplus sp.]
MDSNIFKPKILIVDDIPENLFALEKILLKLDAQVFRASSGNEALARILDHEFALIILDVQMPEMDGYEVAEILKSDEKTENIPIIFVTAIDRDDAKEIKGYGTGAVDFIFKPLNKFILLSKVNVFLELHKIKNGLEQIVEARTAQLSHTNKELKEQIEKNIEATCEIERARAYLLKVINSISSCLISVDSEGKITDMNSHAQHLASFVGSPHIYSPTPAPLPNGEGENNDSLPKGSGGEGQKNYLETYRSEYAAAKSISEVFPFYRFITKNIEKAIETGEFVEKNRIPVYIKGKLVINNFAIYPFSFNDNKGAVIRIDDVTERVKMDEIVIQSEKMLSMGGIAAGMAHEINNPLAGIIQNIQVIRNRIYGDLPANHKAANECGLSLEVIRQYMDKREILRMMDSVQQAGNRAAQIVDDMLSFSRKHEGTLKDENLQELVEKSIKLAIADYKTKSEKDIGEIEIIRNYQQGMPLISCQPSKMQQVLLNIFKNGLQAMENIEYGAVKRFNITIGITDNMASIAIADNGEGMPEEISKKIFQPFFTTRKSGTGLGLSISYFIITEDHKGTLSVFSTEGQGTEFTIKLPLHKSTPVIADSNKMEY